VGAANATATVFAATGVGEGVAAGVGVGVGGTGCAPPLPQPVAMASKPMLSKAMTSKEETATTSLADRVILKLLLGQGLVLSIVCGPIPGPVKKQQEMAFIANKGLTERLAGAFDGNTIGRTVRWM
jgi:hypothetical protein